MYKNHHLSLNENWGLSEWHHVFPLSLGPCCDDECGLSAEMSSGVFSAPKSQDREVNLARDHIFRFPSLFEKKKNEEAAFPF